MIILSAFEMPYPQNKIDWNLVDDMCMWIIACIGFNSGVHLKLTIKFIAPSVWKC